MKIEKIAAVVLGLLVAVFFIIYFTLPEQGEQIYIPQETSVPEEIEIPEGYQRVDNYSNVYYTETEDGYRYLLSLIHICRAFRQRKVHHCPAYRLSVGCKGRRH